MKKKLGKEEGTVKERKVKRGGEGKENEGKEREERKDLQFPFLATPLRRNVT